MYDLGTKSCLTIEEDFTEIPIEPNFLIPSTSVIIESIGIIECDENSTIQHYTMPENDVSLADTFITDLSDPNSNASEEIILIAPDTTSYNEFCLDRYYFKNRFSKKVSYYFDTN